jgi:hypothetical protein
MVFPLKINYTGSVEWCLAEYIVNPKDVVAMPSQIDTRIHKPLLYVIANIK